ncbi:MAG TPA: hypothetical protein VF498_00520 [Anaerolineales bacterium]
MTDLMRTLRRNLTLWITLAVLAVLFVLALQGMGPQDWVITLLRGLSVGALTFLVASGFSLIFGLLDVLNLAHGTLFMIGAYIGWTVFVRPDTFVDLITPLALLAAGFALMPLWDRLVQAGGLPARFRRAWPWLGLLAAIGVLALALPRYPLRIWSTTAYDQSPVTYAFLADQGQYSLPGPVPFSGASSAVVLGGILLGSLLAALSLAGLAHRRGGPMAAANRRLPRLPIAAGLGLVILGLAVFAFNAPLASALHSLNTTWLFLIAMLVTALTGAGLGALMESILIRPLYSRPIYQLMLTLGLSAIGIEMVWAVWGRPEFTMPSPAIFNGSGPGCPAKSLADLLARQCSTISILGGRVRTYNEVFIPLVGLAVLAGIWLLLQRTRLGMVIRAGVQDREMVEALGINVRRVFTLVFALGVGLAALGGVLAGPSMGLSSVMGDNLLLNVLIALAIGGLTSFPGAAVGSLLVGMIQQFIIKYGQIGIHLPFLAEPFKPTPPLVPASTVMLMVIILLILPQGLFGRKE